ncbi:MAG TPA: hypothetical protein VFZ97_04915 [Acidimicrobiales bacterium]
MSTTPWAADPTTGADGSGAPRTFSPFGLRTVLEPLVWGPGALVEVPCVVVEGVKVVGDELCGFELQAGATLSIKAAPARRLLTGEATRPGLSAI